jgi:hypothetical protein
VVQRQCEARGRTSRHGLAATYLLHLVERVLVHAELLKVILRRSDDLVNDLLVDTALESQLARMLSPRHRSPGIY